MPRSVEPNLDAPSAPTAGRARLEPDLPRARWDVIGVGAINLDYIASASAGSPDEDAPKPGLRFEFGTETAVSEAEIRARLDSMRGIDFHPVVGGSSLNAIHALARLGLDLRLGYVGMAGWVPGQSVLARLEDMGIDKRFVFPSQEQAGICLSCVEDGERTLWTHPGANVQLWRFLEEQEAAITAYLATATVIHVSSLFDDKTPDVLLRILCTARKLAPWLRISFDPGHAWAKHPSYAVEGLLQIADYLLLNFREFKALGSHLPGDSDERVARKIFRRCAPTCAVILLKQYNGSTIFRNLDGQLSTHIVRHVPLGEEEIEDATGAGDVFAAGFLAGLTSQNFQVELGTRLGLELAKAKLQFVGTTKFPSLAKLTKDFMAAREAGSLSADWKPKIFIAHGGASYAWRAIKDFLEEDLLLPTASFESDSHEGREVTEALTSYLDECSFAVCVLTAEDAVSDASARSTVTAGYMRARQNVIHEAGLFQGRYGFERVALIIEDGTEVFSNVVGLKKLLFAAGKVETTFHDLRKMLKREKLLR